MYISICYHTPPCNSLSIMWLCQQLLIKCGHKRNQLEKLLLSEDKNEISQFHKMKKKIIQSVRTLQCQGWVCMLYPPTHPLYPIGLLHVSPELSTTCLTLIRACQLEWASVSLIARLQMSKESLAPLSPSSVARSCHTRCWNNVHSSPISARVQMDLVFSVGAENNWEVCVVETSSEVGPQIRRGSSTCPGCSTHWNQGNKTAHSQRSMFLKTLSKSGRKGRVASASQFVAPILEPVLNIEEWEWWLCIGQ